MLTFWEKECLKKGKLTGLKICIKLLDNIDKNKLSVEINEVIKSPLTTHIKYKVKNEIKINMETKNGNNSSQTKKTIAKNKTTDEAQREEALTMLANSLACATVPTTDLKRAKRFYGETLGAQ